MLVRWVRPWTVWPGQKRTPTTRQAGASEDGVLAGGPGRGSWLSSRIARFSASLASERARPLPPGALRRRCRIPHRGPRACDTVRVPSPRSQVTFPFHSQPVWPQRPVGIPQGVGEPQGLGPEGGGCHRTRKPPLGVPAEGRPAHLDPTGAGCSLQRQVPPKPWAQPPLGGVAPATWPLPAPPPRLRNGTMLPAN